MQIAHLDITSWRGISIGAVHWYAELIIDDANEKYGWKRVKLERPLTSVESKAMNIEKKRQGYRSFNYQSGDLTEGFNTREEAIAAGIAAFKASSEGVLMLGDHCSCSAWKKAVYWHESFTPLVNKMNAIADKFQALNGYEGEKRKQVERLDKQFMAKYDAIEKLIKKTQESCSRESKTKKST